MTDLPPNVYRVAQHRFDAIPGSPWIYWVSDIVRQLFGRLPALETWARLGQGLATAQNSRFIRYWWEIGIERIAIECTTQEKAINSGKRWFPHMKGGTARKWYGNREHVINWKNNGEELREFEGAVIRNPDFYFQEGTCWSRTTSSGISLRYTPPGCIIDSESPSVVGTSWPTVMCVLNSTLAEGLLNLINPTIHYQVGDLKRLPIVPKEPSSGLQWLMNQCINWARKRETLFENSFDFVAPQSWRDGETDTYAIGVHSGKIEVQIDNEVYRLYGISDADRAAIEAELAGGGLAMDGDEDESPPADEEEQEASITQEELAVRCISYAVGIVLGRFQPGVPGSLGPAVYRQSDFAVGSLPEPDEAGFDDLVGAADGFAYVDADGGRHLFPAEVEEALRNLTVPDGIAVLDEDHPRDLPALVERALSLMLGADGAQEVINEGASGDLRKFLEKDFFTKWHFRWYRKRPVYWPLQSAKRSYGFVIFHERVDRMTLYTLQRDYLDHKLNGLRLGIGDLQSQLASLSGADRKRVERQIDQATQLLDEVTEFAATMERIVRQGYQPEENWIDDGVILRLAPLWELIPIWWREPKRYWEGLEGGDYDWSHIAMRYWPERVREKCKSNKSFAIAHGLEALFQEQ